MTLEEIKNIDIDIEKEVFIHGALCVSYSGNCLMSAMLGSRSGNRGECVGNCRLKYKLLKNSKVVRNSQYLLSTKDLNTSSKILELLATNIDSFKIEGRMKSPQYVGFITKFYRKLIDQEPFSMEEELDKLKRLFHREFTTGHLFSDTNLMNSLSSNHIGIPIGKVTNVQKDKITIQLFRKLNQEDGIRFLESKKGMIVNYLYDSKNRLISSTNSVAVIDNKINLTNKDHVYKTIDRELLDELSKYPLKKIKIKFFFEAKLGKQMSLIITDYKNSYQIQGDIVEKAKTSIMTKQNIEKQLTKLGDTPFICENIDFDIDNDIFIPVSKLNELRRQATEKLMQLRVQNKCLFLENQVTFPKLETKSKTGYSATIYNEEQLKTCLELGFNYIYVNDLDLYHKYQSKEEVYYKAERNIFLFEETLQSKNLVNQNIMCLPKKLIHGDYFLNITNIYTAYYLLKDGYVSLIPSVELKEIEIANLFKNFKDKFNTTLPLEVLVYGRVCNMMIKKNFLFLDENSTYYLEDEKNKKFPIFYKNGNTYILNYIPNYQRYSFSFPYIKRFDFYDETKEDIINIVNELK